MSVDIEDWVLFADAEGAGREQCPDRHRYIIKDHRPIIAADRSLSPSLFSHAGNAVQLAWQRCPTIPIFDFSCRQWPGLARRTLSPEPRSPRLSGSSIGAKETSLAAMLL